MRLLTPLLPDAPAVRRAPVARPRPYTPNPRPRIPDYPAFCEVAERHSACWETTFEGGELPYRSRHRLLTDVVLTSSGLDAHDHVLTAFQAPSYVRPYIDRMAAVQAVTR